MKNVLLLLILTTATISLGQTHKSLHDYEPTEEFENIHVLKITEDDHQSSYIIWVRDSVPEHYHASHTENIVVISGKAKMTIDGEEKIIRKGDYINIPEGTKHAVLEVYSHKPLKVLSTQTPIFDGDRIFTKPKEN